MGMPSEFEFPNLQGGFRHGFLVSPLHVRLPDDLMDELQAHITAECGRADRVSYGHRLAGRIVGGEQIEASASLPVRLKVLFCRLGRHYLFELAAANEIAINREVAVAFRDSWIVRSLAGDYNPAHKHGGQLSGIVYTAVPPQVADPGHMDGKLQFVFGQLKEENIDFLGPRRVIPSVGDLYLFPAWLTHLVYPFRGDGERVSYSFNLAVQNIHA